METRKCRVFIGWSGKASGDVARHLQRWINKVYPELDPFVSEEIGKGNRWFESLIKRLRYPDTAVICVTNENKTKPWIVFEAGAIGSKLGDGRVNCLLLDLDAGELGDPLEYFQATRFEKQDFYRLIQSLFKRTDLTPDIIQQRFTSKNWSLLSSNIKRAFQDISTNTGSSHQIYPKGTKRIANRSLKRRNEIL